MGMNRPSIANAFGDKESVYRRTLARFGAAMRAHVTAVLADEKDLGRALTSFYEGAIAVYCQPSGSRGCFVMCTAPVEAVAHPEVRRDLQRLVGEIDAVLAERFERARREGQLPEDHDPRASAQVAQAILHSLAIRARAGASKASLRALARHAVRILLA
jgi:TetR/AcrR family transcriptional regulator, copper-responsive repressor